MPSKVGQRCEFCGSTALVPYEEVKDAVPSGVAAAAEDLRVAGARSDSRLVRPAVARAESTSARKALTDTVKGIYLPYWTFDAKADARWTAEAGHVLLRPRGRQATCGRCSWTPASGELSHVFDDELVCASVGVDAARLRSIEPFPDRRRWCRTIPAISSGWTVERYQIDLVAAAAAIARSRWRPSCGSCAGSRCPATRIATSSSTRPSPIRRSSTSSRRSGC